MKVLKNKQPTTEKLLDLIGEIAPLNNRYRDLIKGRHMGSEVLCVMWQVGEILEVFLKRYPIKPHNLYWQIYGKAEGIKNSYITRDLLSYCLRIRRHFATVDDITTQFPTLKKYSLFREAFPLLENPRFKLSEEETRKLKRILNSDVDSNKIKATVLAMKAQHIGIRNTRMQRLQEMEPIRDNFVIVCEEIYNAIKTNDAQVIDNFRNTFTIDLLCKLSEAVAALTQENLYVPEVSTEVKLPVHWKQFMDNLRMLLQSTVETRNRLRRVIPPRKLFNLAEMLNALTTDNSVLNYKKRSNMV
jgi:hypothetical protein